MQYNPDHLVNINKFKKQYFAIGEIPCPAFNNDLVYFNRKGWNHLLRKHGKLRNPKDQLRRLKLISSAEFIIRTSKTWHEHNNQNTGIEFWSFISKHNDKILTVIIRRDHKQKYFFSVMNN